MILLNVPGNFFEASVQFYRDLLGFHAISHSEEHIVLIHEQSRTETIKMTISRRAEVEHSAPVEPAKETDLEGKPLILAVNASSMHDIQNRLKLAQYPFCVVPDTDGEFLTRDPIGSTIFVRQSGRSVTPKPHSRLPNGSEQLVNGDITAVRKRKLAILTSGGDAPGMNAALRAIVRISLVRGCEPFAVYEGYQGLVEGGDKIKRLYWNDVQGILDQGGTIIGTARCKEFRTKEGRKRAAKNLAERGIDALVVVGGDGSLTGADTLRGEWSELLKELAAAGEISQEQFSQATNLHIVGLVGSIDNDMATTDITIGAVTSIHRICEAVDSISSTATSHQRCFVIEVMGRHCGWLALMAAISCGADWLFIPEQPPKEGWEDEMCKLLHRHREMGKRKSIIIVAEGAIDRDLKPIKSEYVKELISTRIKVDTRVTTLGHVQRGGSPAALDRYLATVQGVKAVEAVLSHGEHDESPLIGMSDNKVTAKPLMKAVEMTRAVANAINNKDFDTALSLRDPEFHASLEAFMLTLRDHNADTLSEDRQLRVAIVHTGAPAGGMNAATRALVRYALNRGHKPFVVNNGFAGLSAGEFRPVNWMDVESWTVLGGSKLGTNRSQPSDDIGLCAYQLQKNNIQALVIIGGFEAYTALLQLHEGRKVYPAFCIPTVLIPATISNNVPGTELSLGADTALNVIIEACDRIRQSAYSSRKRVFVVEVQGGRTGYLATMAGLMCGATCSYIPEEGLNLKMIAKDSAHLVKQFTEGENQGRVIIRNECASETYTTEVVSSIFRDEGKGVFDSRSSILGHIQQGGAPSPMDRVRATRMAVAGMQYIEKQAFPSIETHLTHQGKPRSQELNSFHGFNTSMAMDYMPPEILSGSPDNRGEPTIMPPRVSAVAGGVYTPNKESLVVIGIHQGTDIKFSPVDDLVSHTDFKNRKSKDAWWLHLNGLIRVLAKHGYRGE